MNKIQSINCYEKNGKKFVVIVTDDGETCCINASLVKYALEHPRQVKGGDSK